MDNSDEKDEVEEELYYTRTRMYNKWLHSKEESDEFSFLSLSRSLSVGSASG
jgi:hypothetical protein